MPPKFTKAKIKLATQDVYAEMLNTRNFSQIINEMLIVIFDLNPEDTDFYVFPYLGMLRFGYRTTNQQFKKILSAKLNKKLYSTWLKPNKKYRYNIGYLSIPHSYDEEEHGDHTLDQILNEDGLIGHYLGYVLDNKTKTVWLMDSLSSNPLESEVGFDHFLSYLYPEYTQKSYSICSGCGAYEPLMDVVMDEQNIFCHTWTLYYIYLVMVGHKNGIEIDRVFEYLANDCKTEKENLILIKSFARYLWDEYILDEGVDELPEEFSYIYVPKTRKIEYIGDLHQRFHETDEII